MVRAYLKAVGEHGILRAATTNNDAPIFVQTQISQPMLAPRRATAEAYFAPVGPPPEEKTPLSWLQ
jgi:hypothetical protein